MINQRLTHQRLTHFQKFLEILEKLKNIDLKITEDRKSRIHIFLIIRRRNRNIETDQIVEILVEILVYEILGRFVKKHPCPDVLEIVKCQFMHQKISRKM